jgi:methylated-DNA-[protein]-cysteine S-methyltransferase
VRSALAYRVEGWGVGVLHYLGGELVAHDEPEEPGPAPGTRGTPPSAAAALAARLAAFLDGAVDDFADVDCEPAIAAAGLSAFEADVVRAVRRVPRGATASYAEIAARCGRPRAWRATGTACGRGVLGLIVPYHRVIRGDGGIGGYGPSGTARKRRLLALEGVDAR